MPRSREELGIARPVERVQIEAADVRDRRERRRLLAVALSGAVEFRQGIALARTNRPRRQADHDDIRRLELADKAIGVIHAKLLLARARSWPLEKRLDALRADVLPR